MFGRFHGILRTLRVRLAVWITSVVFLMVVLAMLTVREVVRRTLLHEFDQILLADSREVAQVLRKFPDESVKHFLDRKAWGHAHQEWFVQIFDSRRNLLWGTNAPENIPPPDFSSLGNIKNRPAIPLDSPRENGPTLLTPEFIEKSSYRRLITVVTYPPTSPHEAPKQLWIRLGSSTQSLVEDVELLNRIMLLAGLLILLATPLIAYVLAGRATKPLAWIIATTARLQPQKLYERLPIRGTGDELDQLSLTINSMLDRIASYISRQQEFIADSAHELRSPLAAIRTSVEVALNRTRSIEEYQGLLSDVMEECMRLGTLVNRLLLLAEADAGRIPGRDQKARLDKLVRESVDMFHAVAESQGIDLSLEHLDPALVPGDEFYLRQVIRNLIDNAIKFSSQIPSNSFLSQAGGPGSSPDSGFLPVPGSPPIHGWVTVSVHVDYQQEQAILVVADTGRGIPPEDLPRIFNRFFCGDKSRHRREGSGGYGLGLSICQTIVKSLNGSITATSEVGRGSRFTVALPLLVDENFPAMVGI